MKNFLLLFIGIFYFASALAGGHITKAEKKQVIECLGHYSATAVLPAETIEVKNMELALEHVKPSRKIKTDTLLVQYLHYICTCIIIVHLFPINYRYLAFRGVIPACKGLYIPYGTLRFKRRIYLKSNFSDKLCMSHTV